MIKKGVADGRFPSRNSVMA